MTKKELTATVLALLACIIWSGNFVIARGVHEWIPPIGLAFWRWIIAFICILPFSYPNVRKEWSIIIEHWKYLFAMGAFGVATFNTLVYLAAHHTSTHHIALISAIAPIGTLLLVGIFGIERLSIFKAIGAACAFLGAVTVITHGNINTIIDQKWNIGDLLLILSTFIWASWSVGLRLKPKTLSIRAFLTVCMAIGGVCLMPFYIWETIYITPVPFTLKAWSIYLYVGIAASMIAWFFWQYSVETIGPVKTSLIYYSMPIFSGVLAIILLDEPLALYHILGFFLVLIGIIVSNLRKLGVINWFVKKNEALLKHKLNHHQIKD